ncbi:hypothetical protein [Pleomorphomonas sp. PLEO]|uniref:hypothetical protein n=1 Tax=Pleomorphomonas sp. PLEO TaxID=3239306 RepID=UPI00351E6C78
MTIASEANRSGPYLCNGATTHFPYAFRIYDAAHIRVILTDPLGIETTLALATDYTVSGVGDSGGGAVQTATAYASGYRVTLILNVPFTQETDLENQGAYFAETIERAIDLQTQMSLQLKELIARAMVLPVTSSITSEALTSAVLSLSAIQSQMLALVGISADIQTVADIADDVVAAHGNAITAATAADVSVAAAVSTSGSVAEATNQAAAAHSSAESATTTLLALSGALTTLAGAFSVDANGHLKVTYAETAISDIHVSDASGHLLISYGDAA